MERVYIGLGSNLGDREENLRKAIQRLNRSDGVSVNLVSSAVETAPEGDETQPDYLNAIVEVATTLSPQELLDLTQKIEEGLGRKTKGDGASRVIDLDILCFGQKVICSDTLTIPHPLLADRWFVLHPFNEIAPDFVPPIFEESISELYDRLMVLV